MPSGILTMEQLDEVVDAYAQFDEFVVDVETLGPYRLNPHRNDVFWISLGGPGRADAIPCGHPKGEAIIRDPNDDFYRINPSNGHYQEHRVNQTTGRLKWVDVDKPYTEPPKQLWISDVIEALRPLFFSDRRKIGQNIKFDLLSLTKYFGEIPPPPYGDTAVAAKLINENHYSYDLASLVRRAFKFEYDKIGKKGPENFAYSEAHLYSFLDSRYTWLLWCQYVRLLERQGVRHVFDIEMDLLPVLMEMERVGVPVDDTVLDELDRDFTLELNRLQLAVDDRAGKPINLNAGRQKAELVYDILGKPCHLLTPSGERSTSRETLELFSADKTVAQMLEHATINKLKGTFIDGLRRNLWDGRVHPTFNQVGAVSGRLSCKEPNIQQIPSRSERGKRVREIFIASPGHVLVVSDLSQIELRMLAHFTQDPVLLEAYREGIDLHGAMAERVFGEGYSPFDRSLAKNGHFACLYGSSAMTLVRRYNFPNKRVAERVIDGFYTTYKRVGPWKDQVVNEARARKRGKKHGYVETILGRKRRLPALWYVDRGERMAAERQAVSVTISGSAADLFKLAMIDVALALQEQEWRANILMTVHDELVVEVPKRHADEALGLVQEGMEGVRNPFTGDPMLSVPIVAESKIVTRWSDAK